MVDEAAQDSCRARFLGLLHHPPAARQRTESARNITSCRAPNSTKWFDEDEFLEYAEVFGNYYGTATTFPGGSRSGRDTTCCSTSTCKEPRRSKENARGGQHLRICRRTQANWSGGCAIAALDEEKVIQRRLATARREIENYDKYDYILVNDRLEESVGRLRAIVFRNACSVRDARSPTRTNAGRNRGTMPFKKYAGAHSADSGFVRQGPRSG